MPSRRTARASQLSTASRRASTHHGVQQRNQCAGQLTIVRQGAYLEYTQNIVLQHQGEDPTEIDRCLTEIECGRNEICSKEKCRCKDYYEYRNRECRRFTSCDSDIIAATGDVDVKRSASAEDLETEGID
ncbi:hypothetical protein TNCV_3693211 [Trichonephila clavipes]|nr:hypothetical protein TNCV_3693211 [Trichonephila clavipes]